MRNMIHSPEPMQIEYLGFGRPVKFHRYET
nr:MAG TPA: hypothetical protein [Caudoviricetes sp.]